MTNPNAEVSIIDEVVQQFHPEPEEPEAEEPNSQPDAEGPDDEGETGDKTDEVVEEIVEELYELELEGKKTKVPKEFKDAFLRQTDYTQKTQSVAEEKRQIAQERQLFELHRQIDTALATDKSEYHGLLSQAKQLEQQIQQAIAQQDPAQVAMLNAQYTQTRSKLDEKGREIDQKSNQAAQLIQYERMQNLQRAEQEAAKKIPNFSPAVKTEMVAAARKLGYQDFEISEVADPRAYEALWKAAQWDKLQQAKPKITKKAAEAPKTLSAKGTNQQGGEAKVQELRAKFKKTGSSEDMRRYLDAKHQYRKR